jgi:orotate phosphoribosyltransferase
MSDESLRADVLSAAVLRGNFTLRSGKTSTYYVDKYRFQVRPELNLNCSSDRGM